jgi:hypothetical protein
LADKKFVTTNIIIDSEIIYIAKFYLSIISLQSCNLLFYIKNLTKPAILNIWFFYDNITSSIKYKFILVWRKEWQKHV